MNDPTSNKLAKAVERKSKRDKILRELANVQAEIKTRNAQIENLRVELQKESRDVELLESFSLRSLIQSVMGNKEEQLEKEKLEELSARLKYETAAQLLDILRSEEEGLQARLEPLTAEDKALEELLDPASNALSEDEQLEITWDALQKFLKK